MRFWCNILGVTRPLCPQIFGAIGSGVPSWRCLVYVDQAPGNGIFRLDQAPSLQLHGHACAFDASSKVWLDPSVHKVLEWSAQAFRVAAALFTLAVSQYLLSPFQFITTIYYWYGHHHGTLHYITILLRNANSILNCSIFFYYLPVNKHSPIFSVVDNTLSAPSLYIKWQHSNPFNAASRYLSSLSPWQMIRRSILPGKRQHQWSS